MRMSIQALMAFAFCGLLFFAAELSAQPYLQYAYDNAGNRVAKMFALQKQGIGEDVETPIYHDHLGAVSVKIYPNPALERVTLELSHAADAPSSLRVTDIRGKILYHIDAPQEVQHIDVAAYAAGTYYLQLIHKDQVSSWLFIKQ